jgi:hypothetical protein
LPSRAPSLRAGQTIDGNQEFIGQGLSNIAGSFLSGYPSSGSFTRSGVNFDAGAATPLAAVFASLILMAILFFIAPVVAYLPIAAMAGVLFVVAWGSTCAASATSSPRGGQSRRNHRVLRDLRRELLIASSSPVGILSLILRSLGTRPMAPFDATPNPDPARATPGHRQRRKNHDVLQARAAVLILQGMSLRTIICPPHRARPDLPGAAPARRSTGARWRSVGRHGGQRSLRDVALILPRRVLGRTGDGPPAGSCRSSASTRSSAPAGFPGCMSSQSAVMVDAAGER